MKVNTLWATFTLLLLLAVPQAPATGQPFTLMVLGDSLSIGYGLEPGQSWPEQLQRLLAEEGTVVRLVNASVSGDTMDDGRARLDWTLAENPNLCVVALGGNDGLRMLDTDRMQASLDAILTTLDQREIPIIVAGMLPPPNFGPDYSDRFRAVFPRMAEAHGARLVPFLLEGVAGHPELNLPDGIHPTAAGAKVVAERLLPMIRDAVNTVAQNIR
ncbi:MAG: arylesterase [Proteobacteria bacterium]|nr:arylesterase [Pseudomonadota bacterium]